MAELMNADDVGRALKRIAHEIIERNHGLTSVVLLGIPTRGSYLSARIAEILKNIEGEVPAGTLDITLHRDDLRTRAPRPLLPTVTPKGGIEGKDVVLIDDVAEHLRLGTHHLHCDVVTQRQREGEDRSRHD